MMRYLITLMAVFTLTFCGENKNMATNLEARLKAYLENQSAEIAVALDIPDRHLYLGINDTVVMHAASTMKVPVMIEVFRQTEQGKFDLDDSLEIKNEFKSIIDGSPYSMDIADDGGDRLYGLIGKKESIRNIVIDMIIWSGNLATNLLIDLVQADSVQKTMHLLGAEGMQVLRGVEDIKAYRAGKSNTTTAKALTQIFRAILANEAANQSSCTDMLAILMQQKYGEKIPAGLPDGVKVAHKTGSITKISHDSGIIFPPGKSPYILTVLTRGYEDGQEAKQVIAQISRMVYAALQ